MSILIKNMVMPKNCTDCPCLDGQNGICQANVDKEYVYSNKPSWCPLVGVKPHGRLIDADALHIDLMERGIADVKTNDWYEIRQAVDDAPTIIEAEETNK